MNNFIRGVPLLVWNICFFHFSNNANTEQLTGLNLALGKPTWQYPTGWKNSDLAVDGDTQSEFNHGSCTHTAENNYEKPAYWSVDLGDEFYLTVIKIYNRKEFQERLLHFRIYGYPGKVKLFDDASQASAKYTVKVYPVQRFKNITVFLPAVENNHSILTLCEVQVFGGCHVPAIQNGYFYRGNDLDSIVPSGTQIEAKCSVGYKFINETNNMTCTHNYTWDNPVSVCTVIKCKSLTLINGKYTYNQIDQDNLYAFGSVATAECKIGFDLQGIIQRKCEDTESWSGADPHCTVVMCNHPGKLDYGNYIINDTDLYVQGSLIYNTTIKTVCEEGFILSPNQTRHRRCNEDGTRTDSTPKCDLILCNILQNTTSASFRVLHISFNTYPGYCSTVQWSCNGYPDTKHGIQTCSENGTWIGRLPLCHTEVFSGTDETLNGRLIASISINVVSILIIFALLFVTFIFKRKYDLMVQQSAVYIDLSSKPGATSQESVYTNISSQ